MIKIIVEPRIKLTSKEILYSHILNSPRPLTIKEIAPKLGYSEFHTRKLLGWLKDHVINHRSSSNTRYYWHSDFKIFHETLREIAIYLDQNGPSNRHQIASAIGKEVRYTNQIIKANPWLFTANSLLPNGKPGRPKVYFTLAFDPFDHRSIKPYPLFNLP